MNNLRKAAFISENIQDKFFKRKFMYFLIEYISHMLKFDALFVAPAVLIKANMLSAWFGMVQGPRVGVCS